jgi:hypothetical protein
MPVIQATGELDIGRIKVQGQPGQKVKQDPISTNKLRMVEYACHTSCAGSIWRTEI